jgi:hypothetical protein
MNLSSLMMRRRLSIKDHYVKQKGILKDSMNLRSLLLMRRDHSPEVLDFERTCHQGTGIHQRLGPQNLVHLANLVSAAAENAAHVLGPQNMLMSGPAAMAAIPMNSSMPPPVHLANRMGGSFDNPPQQFLPPQPKHGVAWRATSNTQSRHGA